MTLLHVPRPAAFLAAMRKYTFFPFLRDFTTSDRSVETRR